MLELISICVASFLVLVWHSRLVGVSLGLPIAYLFSMMLQHLPGAYAHLVAGNLFVDSSATQIGLRFTAIGTGWFVIGVVLAQRVIGAPSGKSDARWLLQGGISRFAVNCLLVGWILVFALNSLIKIPSLGAAIDQGGAVWILGVLIGFLASVRQRRYGHILLWLAALSVYPLVVLVWGGFLSFGSTSVFVVMSALLVISKSHVRAYVGLVVFSLLCFLLFLSYFQTRSQLRGTEILEERAAYSAKIITDFKWFDSSDPKQLGALDARLNQNQFVGMAAQRIESGQTGILHGRSVWEGMQALVPRILWPSKPIFAGSSELIREMTGFVVSEGTSYGPGQVMEFYVNFGVPGVVVGFLLLGFAYGWVDRKAAAALQGGEFGRAILWFLWGVAMCNPLAPISELVGNIAAALVAAYGWRYAWGVLEARTSTKRLGGTGLGNITKREGGAVHSLKRN